MVDSEGLVVMSVHHRGTELTETIFNSLRNVVRSFSLGALRVSVVRIRAKQSQFPGTLNEC
jgi:hypothetical protein